MSEHDKDTFQYLIRPPRTLIKRLDSAAQKFGQKSGNQVAVEVIAQYLEFWEQLEEAKQKVFNEQRQRLFGENETKEGSNNVEGAHKPASRPGGPKGKKGGTVVTPKADGDQDRKAK